MRHANWMQLMMALVLAGCAAPSVGPVPEPTPEPTPEVVRVPLAHVDGSPIPDDLEWHPLGAFPDVALGGSLVHDWGMDWAGVRVGDRFYAFDAMSPVVLGTVGWERADAARRLAIAEDYCRELLGWRSMMRGPNAHFALPGAPAFTPMVVEAREGRIIVRAWRDDTRVGMRPPHFRNYRQFEAVFAPDGTVTTRVCATYDAPIGS